MAIVVGFRGAISSAAVGFGLAAAAVLTIRLPSPWRFPDVPFWRLMLPLYALFGLVLAWGAWALGSPRALGINGWWSALLLIPLTMPVWLVGKQRWSDSDG